MAKRLLSAVETIYKEGIPNCDWDALCASYEPWTMNILCQ